MSELSSLAEDLPGSKSATTKLPIHSIVRSLCEAANGGPELLYEAMIKVSLMVEATAPTYGLSIWAAPKGGRPNLRWAEGLEESEIALAEKSVTEVFAGNGRSALVNPGDSSISLLLALPSSTREGAALYGRCVRPLTAEQARELNALGDVAFLAHSHQKSGANGVGSNGRAAIAVSNGLPGMVFSSRAMSDVARSVERIKDSESTVLVTGESGTGKELIARAIHRLGRRADKEFVPFNCSAVPAELIESMLFGHRKGTFTGALSDQLGLIGAAESGTLF